MTAVVTPAAVTIVAAVAVTLITAVAATEAVGDAIVHSSILAHFDILHNTPGQLNMPDIIHDSSLASRGPCVCDKQQAAFKSLHC